MDGYLIWDKIAENSDSAFAGLDRFGVGRFGIGAVEDPVAEVMRAGSPSPSPSIGSGPSGVTADQTPVFAFSSIAGGATFGCRVGTAAAPGVFSACVWPFAAPALADGARVFEVRSPVGDPTPARRSFIVDTGPPQTAIAGVASGLTNDATPRFDLLPDEPGGSFQCRLGTPTAPGAFAPCESPFMPPSPLADGIHVLEVPAIDAVGTVDATPAARTFTVDTVAPETTIDSAPPAVTDDPAPQIAFSSADGGASFECRVDGGAFAACSSPRSLSLANGPHVYEVRAVDAAGNADPTPAVATFRVDAPVSPPPAPAPPPPPAPAASPPPPPAGPPPPPPPAPPASPPPPAQPGPRPPSAPARPAAGVIGAGVPGTVRVGRDGRVRLDRPRVRCPAAAPACTVSTDVRAVVARGRATRIGRSADTIAPGASARVTFVLTRAARATLKGRGVLRGSVRIAIRHAGVLRAKTVRITLKPGSTR